MKYIITINVHKGEPSISISHREQFSKDQMIKSGTNCILKPERNRDTLKVQSNAMFGGNPGLSVSKDVIDAYVHLTNGDYRTGINGHARGVRLDLIMKDVSGNHPCYRIYYATPSFVKVNGSKKFGEGNSQSNKEKYLADITAVAFDVDANKFAIAVACEYSNVRLFNSALDEIRTINVGNRVKHMTLIKGILFTG